MDTSPLLLLTLAFLSHCLCTSEINKYILNRYRCLLLSKLKKVVNVSAVLQRDLQVEKKSALGDSLWCVKILVDKTLKAWNCLTPEQNVAQKTLNEIPLTECSRRFHWNWRSCIHEEVLHVMLFGLRMKSFVKWVARLWQCTVGTIKKLPYRTVFLTYLQARCKVPR